MEPARDPSIVTAPPSDASPEERRYYAVNRAEWAWFARYYDAITRPMRRLRREVVEAVAAPPTRASSTSQRAPASRPSLSRRSPPR